MGLAETQWGLYPDCPEKSLSGMVSKEDCIEHASNVERLEQKQYQGG